MEVKLYYVLCLVVLSLTSKLESTRVKVKIFPLNENEINNIWFQFKRNHNRPFQNFSVEKLR